MKYKAGTKVKFGRSPTVGITTSMVRYNGQDIEEIYVEFADGDACFVSSAYLSEA